MHLYLIVVRLERQYGFLRLNAYTAEDAIVQAKTILSMLSDTKYLKEVTSREIDVSKSQIVDISPSRLGCHSELRLDSLIRDWFNGKIQGKYFYEQISFLKEIHSETRRI